MSISIPSLKATPFPPVSWAPAPDTLANSTFLVYTLPFLFFLPFATFESTSILLDKADNEKNEISLWTDRCLCFSSTVLASQSIVDSQEVNSPFRCSQLSEGGAGMETWIRHKWIEPWLWTGASQKEWLRKKEFRTPGGKGELCHPLLFWCVHELGDPPSPDQPQEAEGTYAFRHQGGLNHSNLRYANSPHPKYGSAAVTRCLG